MAIAREMIDHSKGGLSLIVIGIDHRTTQLELREKVAYSSEQAEELLKRLVASDAIAEACLLSTCNRTELYLLPRDRAAAYRLGLEAAFLSRAPAIEEEGLFYVKRDLLAARHLMEVACGLQSMILGEPEILGQVKEATGLAEAVGASGPVLQKLLRAAIAAGGRARHETGITSGAVSFGYAVVDLARSIFKDVEDCAVLLVGAGEIAHQVARSFSESGTRKLRVVNRSKERAEAFRKDFPHARILSYEAFCHTLHQHDVVVTSTGAKEPILRHRDVAHNMRTRKNRPLLLADLGVPRNIEPSAGRIGNVFLQDIDSLEELIARNLKLRREEIPQAHEILDRELEIFEEWHRGLRAEPVVARLQKSAESVRRREVEAVRHRFPADLHGELEKLTRSLVRKILHHPSQRLRHGATLDVEKLGWVRELFQLDEETE